MTKDKVIERLKAHKGNIAIHETLINDYSATLKASSLDSKVQTSNVSDLGDVVEKINKELEDLEKEIKRVQIWLNYLTEEERFYIDCYYIQSISTTSIITRWCNAGNSFRSEFFWKKRKYAALEKIIALEKRARIR